MTNETLAYITIIESYYENHPNADNISDAYCLSCLNLNRTSKELNLSNEMIGIQFVALNEAYQYILETKHGVQP